MSYPQGWDCLYLHIVYTLIMSDLTIEQIIRNVLTGTTLTMADVWRKDKNHFVAKFTKEVNRQLRSAGFGRSERAYVLRRKYSHIYIWDKKDEKNNKEILITE